MTFPVATITYGQISRATKRCAASWLHTRNQRPPEGLELVDLRFRGHFSVRKNLKAQDALLIPARSTREEKRTTAAILPSRTGERGDLV
jgi:hypothetical protein